MFISKCQSSTFFSCLLKECLLSSQLHARTSFQTSFNTFFNVNISAGDPKHHKNVKKRPVKPEWDAEGSGGMVIFVQCDWKFLFFVFRNLGCFEVSISRDSWSSYLKVMLVHGENANSFYVNRHSPISFFVNASRTSQAPYQLHRSYSRVLLFQWTPRTTAYAIFSSLLARRELQ